MSIAILQQIIASLFKRKSSEILGTKELELLVSMELRWFDPPEARKLVELSKRFGIIEDSNGGLKPTFDVTKIEIPLGFKPPKNILNEVEQTEDSLFIQLVNKICINTNQNQTELIGEINTKQSDLHDYLVPEVIAILLAKEKGVVIDDFITPIKNKLLNK